MVALQRMRMVCNSTWLVDRETDFGLKSNECRLLLDDLLTHPENKVVIFSQWLGTHEVLMRKLKPQRKEYAYYHGSLQVRERQEVIEAGLGLMASLGRALNALGSLFTAMGQGQDDDRGSP